MNRPNRSALPHPWKVRAFLVCAAVALALMARPLAFLVLQGRPPEFYSHIPLVPVISAAILYGRRKVLFRGGPGSPAGGGACLAAGLLALAVDAVRGPGPVEHAGLVALAGLLVMAGGFLLLFGRKAFVRALFPFLFLGFMIPLPLAWMSGIVAALVAGSTGVTALLLRAFRVPFVQEGAVFLLPGFDLQVAFQCSGIRSTLALLITAVLAGQMFLRGRSRKSILALAVFPVSILKNGARIVILYLLSYFVDMRIIDGGFLHKSGGFIFFGLGLVLLGLALWALRGPGEEGGGIDKRSGLGDNKSAKEKG
ncbi:MAG TPA: exosortase/archaeosortase family protein [Candidatus Aminicenantes bacterium]|nr:exosortase/archaeosortase family protein [Candidatus Aminicenantes bacterium]HRY64901.1 exosortase/archaeosortase family protein [Candidatus Aminicenantes bacterium]HRZ71814.1 exosortase/archaeosortase family protein [Candidatus Aminicenantes bacterium]